MKSLIVFASSHGTTEKVSRMLRDHLEEDVSMIDLGKERHPDLTPYDCVIIGGSIHAGSIQGKVKKFIKDHHDELKKKKIALFLCCMSSEQAQEQFDQAFPADLRSISIANGLFGGEFLLSKMNFIERFIVKKVSGVTSELSKIDEPAIKSFAEKIRAAI